MSPPSNGCEHDVWMFRVSVPPALLSRITVSVENEPVMVNSPPSGTLVGFSLRLPLGVLMLMESAPTVPVHVTLPAACVCDMAAHPPPVYLNVIDVGLPSVSHSSPDFAGVIVQASSGPGGC